MDIIDKLTEIFKEFPGIGERQARRFVYYLMRRDTNYSENIIRLINELKKEISQCKECFKFFLISKNKNSVCEICADPSTDQNLLMIVEKDSDLESIKKSRMYPGKYFVLGGLVPIVEKNTKKYVRIEELKNKIEKEKSNLKEIILAFSLNPQGDHTDHFVRGEIQKIADENSIKISSLGRGLSTGTELEYSDNETIKNALKNRQ